MFRNPITMITRDVEALLKRVPDDVEARRLLRKPVERYGLVASVALAIGPAFVVSSAATENGVLAWLFLIGGSFVVAAFILFQHSHELLQGLFSGYDGLVARNRMTRIDVLLSRLGTQLTDEAVKEQMSLHGEDHRRAITETIALYKGATSWTWALGILAFSLGIAVSSAGVIVHMNGVKLPQWLSAGQAGSDGDKHAGGVASKPSTQGMPTAPQTATAIAPISAASGPTSQSATVPATTRHEVRVPVATSGTSLPASRPSTISATVSAAGSPTQGAMLPSSQSAASLP